MFSCFRRRRIAPTPTALLHEFPLMHHAILLAYCNMLSFVDERLYIASQGGQVLVIDKFSSMELSERLIKVTPNPILDIRVFSNVFFVLTLQKTLFRYDLRTNAITTLPMPNISCIGATFAHKIMVFTQSGDGSATRCFVSSAEASCFTTAQSFGLPPLANNNQFHGHPQSDFFILHDPLSRVSNTHFYKLGADTIKEQKNLCQATSGNKIVTVACSYNHKHLYATLSNTGTLQVMDVQTHIIQRQLHIEFDTRCQVQPLLKFTPDSRFLVIAIPHQAIQFWNLETDQISEFSVKGPSLQIDHPLRSISFSNNGKMMAVLLMKDVLVYDISALGLTAQAATSQSQQHSQRFTVL